MVVTNKDCDGIEKNVVKLMPEYSAADREYVIKNLNNKCKSAVENKQTILMFMYKTNNYLKELGLI